jgi:hypothetical protein
VRLGRHRELAGERAWTDRDPHGPRGPTRLLRFAFHDWRIFRCNAHAGLSVVLANAPTQVKTRLGGAMPATLTALVAENILSNPMLRVCSTDDPDQADRLSKFTERIWKSGNNN